MTRKGSRDPKTWMPAEHCRKMTLSVCLEVPNKARRFLERRHATVWHMSWEIMTIAVASPLRITKVFYTPDTRKRRPGGTRKEASGSQYCDIVNV
jgi:hypothetical protein